MAEYNIQMNRYVSASDSYDQLFPKTKTIDVVDQNGDNLDTLLGEKIDYDEKGAANGVASLGADGKVPSSQLPAIGYSKNETLTAATAALFGLPNTAVPDDVLAWLGKYNEYCWKRRTVEYEYSENPVAFTTAEVIGTVDPFNIKYASSVTADASGIHLVSPIETSVSRNASGAQQIANLAPCYFSSSKDNYSKVYYLPTEATSGTSSSYTVFYQSSNYSLCLSASSAIKAHTVQLKTTTTYGESELLFSTNRSAYPDSGIVDGYEYEYLGVPFDKLPIAPRIETGSYVGTGTYGASNPNSLTFGFVPKFLMVWIQAGSSQTRVGIFNVNTSTFITDIGYVYVKASSTGPATTRDTAAKTVDKTTSWYCTDADTQLNASGVTYGYTAIG